MNEPTFDIFSGGPDSDPLWLESAIGLLNARERMEMIAAKKPGQYFIFSVLAQTVVAQIEVLKKCSANS